MPIVAMEIETGEVVYRANFFLKSNNEIEFFEIFEQFIFFKQRNYQLVIFSVVDCEGDYER